MVMKYHDAKKRLKLLWQWDFQCALCGHGFRDISSVTVEHLAPRSLGGARRFHENQAPSHHNCNQFRGNDSLIVTMKKIARKRRVLGPAQFEDWINAKVPNRDIPPFLMAICVKKPRRTLQCLELPTWLPGMPLFSCLDDP